MSAGDYQNFNLDLRDTGCVEEVLEAIIQHKINYYDDVFFQNTKKK